MNSNITGAGSRVSTFNNILDSGTGSMTIAGDLTANKNMYMTSGFGLYSTNAASNIGGVYIDGTNGNLRFAGGTPTSEWSLQNSTNNKILYASNTRAVKTILNTLDDGAGNMSVIATPNADPFSSSQLTIYDRANLNYQLHLGTTRANASAVIQSEEVTVGYGRLRLNPKGGVVQTRNNILDDGSTGGGNMIVGSLTSAGTGSFNNLVVNGNTVLDGNGNFTTTGIITMGGKSLQTI
jgi:hypothetical protein